jgi:lipoprotein signal peptidase
VVTTHFGTVTLRNNIFHNNSTDQSGGGVYYGPGYSDTPVFLRDNIFSNNSANQYGGGYNGGSLGITENNIFMGNSANEGGGWYGGTSLPEAIFRNNIFIRNSAITDGGAIHIWGDNHFTNNTIYQNMAANSGGGIYIDLTSALRLAAHVYNNIIWGNIAKDGNDFRIQGLLAVVDLYNNDFNEFTIQDSSHLFQGNNINANPQFADILSDDYHLSSTSPCIDAGTAGAPFLPLKDFDGGTRIYHKKPDIGADEVGLTLFSPQGGEEIPSGSTFLLEWQSPPNAVRFNLRYSLDNGETWRAIINNLTVTDYDWPVPTPAGNKRNCLVRVIGYNASGLMVGTDISKPFTIEVAKIVQPNGGETLSSGSSYPIQWEINGTKSPVTKVNLYYTMDGGVSYGLINNLAGSDRSYNWTVPTPLRNKKNTCYVKVVAYNGSTIVGSVRSDKPFTIEVAKIVQPNGGEALKSGSSYPIQWEINGTRSPVTKVNLYYTKNKGVSYGLITSIQTVDPGTRPWAMSHPWTPMVMIKKPYCKVKVVLYNTENIILSSDVSDRYLTISP